MKPLLLDFCLLGVFWILIQFFFAGSLFKFSIPSYFSLFVFKNSSTSSRLCSLWHLIYHNILLYLFLFLWCWMLFLLSLGIVVSLSVPYSKIFSRPSFTEGLNPFPQLENILYASSRYPRRRGLPFLIILFKRPLFLPISPVRLLSHNIFPFCSQELSWTENIFYFCYLMSVSPMWIWDRRKENFIVCDDKTGI